MTLRSRLLLLGCVVIAGAARTNAELPASVSGPSISIAGSWQFQLDPEDIGARDRWYARPLADTIDLPGTTDLAHKGYQLDPKRFDYSRPATGHPEFTNPTGGTRAGPPGPSAASDALGPVAAQGIAFTMTQWPGVGAVKRLDHAGFLLRPWYYVGKAWYQREVEIPARWRDQFVSLTLERVIWRTDVWLDDHYIGSRDSLVAAHEFELGQLRPGTHRLTIRVDNGLVHNIGWASHSYGPETQSRWNGIVGRMELTTEPALAVRKVQCYPEASRQSVRVATQIVNRTATPAQVTLAVSIEDASGRVVGVLNKRLSVTHATESINVDVPVTGPVIAWDEFHPTRYRMKLEVRSPSGVCRRAVWFGFRELCRQGRQLLINGRRLFLRGTLDCCVYPATGHPPTTVDQWLRVLGTIKEHGFNHVRYHSWCPPEAAFEAADRLGLYLAPETPFWVDTWISKTAPYPKLLGEDPDVLDYVRREIRRIADHYGNHPSFAFFCIGNEFGLDGDWEVVNRLVQQAKQHDQRHLYNGATTRRRVAADDYWVTAYNGSQRARGVGPAHTDWDFAETAASVDLPIVAHETGQRPVFPDYDTLLPKFNGPLRPDSLRRFRAALAQRGLLSQMHDFQRASAEFQFLLYKAEHEAFLRTPDFAGFQLLMLNDFTGQSEALVGILDPFWQSKGVISSARVRQWCSPTVPLARFERYVWSSNETFAAHIEVRHNGPRDFENAAVHWTLTTRQGQQVAGGPLNTGAIPTGTVTQLGTVNAPLNFLSQATALLLRVVVADSVNEWTIWVYPHRTEEPEPDNIVVTQRFDDRVKQQLAAGRRVLLQVPKPLNQFTRRGQFLPVYWSAGWSLKRLATLGLLCNPRHPALAQFPNTGHSDWQWYELAQGGTLFVMDNAPPTLRPIVQAVPDFHQNHLLGQVFETRVGPGRLLVCGYDLETNLERRLAARQMRRSLLAYMRSDRFAPQAELPINLLEAWLTSTNTLRNLGCVIKADSTQPGYDARQAIDGNLDTLWHTRWTPTAPPHPHWIAVDLLQPRSLAAVTYTPRQDQANGRVQRYQVFVSNSDSSWGPPVASGKWTDGTGPRVVRFTKPVTGRCVKFVAQSEVDNRPFSSIAEFDVILTGP